MNVAYQIQSTGGVRIVACGRRELFAHESTELVELFDCTSLSASEWRHELARELQRHIGRQSQLLATETPEWCARIASKRVRTRQFEVQPIRGGPSARHRRRLRAVQVEDLRVDGRVARVAALLRRHAVASGAERLQSNETLAHQLLYGHAATALSREQHDEFHAAIERRVHLDERALPIVRAVRVLVRRAAVERAQLPMPVEHLAVGSLHER